MTKAQELTYKSLIKSGKVKNHYEAILLLLQDKCLTIYDIKTMLKLPVSSVSGRVSELCDQGLLKVDRKVKNRHKEWKSLYTTTHKGEQERLKQSRRLEKIRRCKLFLRNEGYKVYKSFNI
jgi:Mn-dependent DtxR family transcriptional regulator